MDIETNIRREIGSHRQECRDILTNIKASGLGHEKLVASIIERTDVLYEAAKTADQDFLYCHKTAISTKKAYLNGLKSAIAELRAVA
jgi:hypothetical protein